MLMRSATLFLWEAVFSRSQRLSRTDRASASTAVFRVYPILVFGVFLRRCHPAASRL
jgi:hypothetical protein